MRATVDVWQIDLSDRAMLSAGDLNLLSDHERARHGLFLAAEAARIFSTTRIALRRILLDHLGCDPSALNIRTGPNGKPFVASSPGVFFNLSHSAQWAAVALCSDFEVGIDIEDLASAPSAVALAKTICTPAEQACLDVEPALRGERLMQVWTRKEAVLKALGEGLTLEMTSIDLGDVGSEQGVLAWRGDVHAPWRDLAGWPGIVGAVAVMSTQPLGIDLSVRRFTSGAWGSGAPDCPRGSAEPSLTRPARLLDQP